CAAGGVEGHAGFGRETLQQRPLPSTLVAFGNEPVSNPAPQLPHPRQRAVGWHGIGGRDSRGDKTDNDGFLGRNGSGPTTSLLPPSQPLGPLLDPTLLDCDRGRGFGLAIEVVAGHVGAE